MTIGNFFLYLTGVHFRGKLQHGGDVSSKKSGVDKPELEKLVVFHCQTYYMLVSFRLVSSARICLNIPCVMVCQKIVELKLLTFIAMQYKGNLQMRS